MKLFDVLVHQRRFLYLAVALLSAAGIGSALVLPSAIYPELMFPRIAIVAEGSSLGARQVVFSITRPIEEAVSVVPGVLRVRSKSIRGASEISMWFAPRTDMIYALQLVQARISQVASDLPAGLDIRVERLTPSLFPVLSYNLEGGDPATLNDIALYEIKPVLSRVPGVGRVDVQGTDVRELEVVADPARLASLGITYDQLAADIRQAITPEAVGRIAKDYRQYLIVTDQEAHTPEDVGSVAIGGGLRVRDVATVSLGTEDHVRVIAGDGRPAALLNITRQVGGNTLELADSVARAMAALAPTLPPGVHYKVVYDQAELVRDAVKSVRDAMLIGAALAVVILLAFLRHGRITAVSATSIPLTLIITVFVMNLLGQTFNLMTLGAMAIAIGLVIDDAVVITENIARHLALVDDRRAAIREAVQELIWPVTTSTITTVVVFLPLGLLQGVVGQFFAALSLTLTIAVLISLLLALTIIPLLADQFLAARETPVGEEAGGARQGGLAAVGLVARGLDGLGDRYVRALGAVLHHPRRMLAGAGVLIVAGVAAQRYVGSGFLPDMDEGAFVLDYWTPGGTALAETDRELRLVESILARTPEVTGTSRRTGAELGLFATLQNTGDVVVRLKRRSERSRSIFQVMDTVRDQVNAAVPTLHIEFVQILSDVINDLAGGAKPIELKLFGSNLDSLEAYARRLAPALSKVDGIEDLYDGVSFPSAEMMMRVDGAEAGRLGLTPAQVGDAVSGALLGVNAGQVRTDDRAINVRARAPDSVRFDALKLGTIPVAAGARGRSAPLAAVATLRPLTSRAELDRENQQQMIAMTADVSGRSLGQIMHDVRAVLAAQGPPGGLRIEFGGQYASQQDAFRAMLMVLGIAAVSVVAVMVLQFESFVEPLVIALAAPVSFIGAIGMLLGTGTALNVSSFMGLILLVGLIVKNGIILLDFTRRRGLLDGLPLERAIIDAARVRLRPILMTTLCTLFGLFPLALALGAGSEMQQPLALAVIGGLAVSTPITLFLVPTLVVAIRGGDYVPPRRTTT
ncbi:MAG TPA: efflux RND transporter permease subunit [Gemmatimonadales bacterium]|nr:efflux RND transporter permease subunit [Gemmatimonadales bacterium]